MKNRKKKILAIALSLSLVSAVNLAFAEDDAADSAPELAPEAAEIIPIESEGSGNDAVVYADDTDNPDCTVIFEYDGEDEEQLKKIKKSNTDVSITHDYAASGNGALFVKVTGAYGSMQFPFDLETGKLYQITYSATAPTSSGETWLQRNIYAKPKGAHQGSRRLENEKFVTLSQSFYYPDQEFTDATFGFYCNDAGKMFVLDDVKMVRYDDFGVSKSSYFYDGIQDIEVYSDFYLRLNYEINRSTLGAFSIEDQDGNTVNVSSYDVMNDNQTIIISHGLLENNKEYTLKLDSVTDQVGRKLENLEVKFKTVPNIVVSDLGFSQSKLTSGEIGLTGKIENHSMEEQNVVLKMWLYRDLLMPQRISIPVTLQMGSTVDLADQKITVPELSNGTYSLAASVWEDDFKLRPLCKSAWLLQ